jgi:precorrin-6B methylase 2
MIREKVKKFWLERAKTTELPRSESQVNFEKNKQIADLRVDAEVALINAKLLLNPDYTIVDLGAGNGRFSILFAPKVQKVVAVEYVKDFSDFIIQQAEKLNYVNIEVMNMPAEDYCCENYVDVVFVSGLLHYLDTEQYNQTIKNISKMLKSGGTLFLRETISVLENEFIVDKFSDELESHYCSIYRTSHQHIEAFCNQGFSLKEYSAFFENGNILNKRLETQLYYFILTKER